MQCMAQVDDDGGGGDGGGGRRFVREEDATGRAACPAAGHDRRRRDGHHAGAAGTAGAGPRRADRDGALPTDPAIGSKNLDELNRESPLEPVFFALDSYELSAEARTSTPGSRRGPAPERHLAGDRRGALRRARHGRVQPVARRAARACRQGLPGVARDRDRAAPDGELRPGIPLRPRARRGGVGPNRRAHFVITAK